MISASDAPMALNSLAAAEIALRVIRAPNSSAPSLVSVTTNPAGMLRMWSRILKEAFLADLHDWESAVKPAYAEHKIALGYGVYGTPKHVIDGKLVPDTESAWGAAEWAEKLKSL